MRAIQPDCLMCLNFNSVFFVTIQPPSPFGRVTVNAFTKLKMKEIKCELKCMYSIFKIKTSRWWHLKQHQPLSWLRTPQLRLEMASTMVSTVVRVAVNFFSVCPCNPCFCHLQKNKLNAAPGEEFICNGWTNGWIFETKDRQYVAVGYFIYVMLFFIMKIGDVCFVCGWRKKD